MKLPVGVGQRDERGLDFSAFKEPAFAFFAIGNFLAFAGLYVPYFYIQIYGLDTQATSGALAFYILSIMNGGALFGRIVRRVSLSTQTT